MLQEDMVIPAVETIEGEVEETASTLGHGLIASRLQQALGPFVEKHDLGHVFSAQTFFRIGTETRDTDLAYVAKERLANLPPDLDVDADFAPDLAVEIAARTDALANISRKVSAYLDASVQAVWVVNPWCARSTCTDRTGRSWRSRGRTRSPAIPSCPGSASRYPRSSRPSSLSRPT